MLITPRTILIPEVCSQGIHALLSSPFEFECSLRVSTAIKTYDNGLARFPLLSQNEV